MMFLIIFISRLVGTFLIYFLLLGFVSKAVCLFDWLFSREINSAQLNSSQVKSRVRENIPKIIIIHYLSHILFVSRLPPDKWIRMILQPRLGLGLLVFLDPRPGQLLHFTNHRVSSFVLQLSLFLSRRTHSLPCSYCRNKS